MYILHIAYITMVYIIYSVHLTVKNASHVFLKAAVYFITPLKDCWVFFQTLMLEDTVKILIINMNKVQEVALLIRSQEHFDGKCLLKSCPAFLHFLTPFVSFL